ncbi:MAG: PAS domain-containing protein [Chloroflexi bacterium]|nr:PAS domain-containing protein [Chloroflexota bacterium]
MSKSMVGKILVAGDDERVLQTLAQNLTRMGYTVLTVVNGEQALQVYEREQPDIALIDAQMPRIDGFGVLGLIREKTLQAEVIMVTAHGDMDMAVKALHAGASDFCPKPVDQISLDTVLERAQKRLRLRYELYATQEALRASEEQHQKAHEQLNTTLNALPDLLFEVDRHGRIYDFRAPRPELLYAPPDEFLGQTMGQVLPKEVSNIIMDAINQAVEKGQHTGTIYSLETAAGASWFELSVAAKGDPKTSDGRLVMLVRDITERKQAEDALREERNKAQKYLDIAGVIITVIDADQTVSLVNRKGCEILEYQEEEIIGKNWFDCVIPEKDRDRVKAGFEQLMSGKIELVEYFENSILTKNGKERIIAWHNTVLRDETDQIIAALSSGEDVTERKLAKKALQKAHNELEIRVAERTSELGKAITELQIEVAERKRVEQALQAQQNLLETIFDATPDLLTLKDRDFVYKAVNFGFCQSVGKPEEEIIGKTDFDLFPKPEAERRRHGDAQVMESSMPQVHDEQVSKEQVKRWVQIAKTPVFDETGASVGVLCSVHDITERKLAEWTLGERVKELTCFYAIHRDMQKELPLDQLCERIVEHLSNAMQFPKITVPVIELYGIQFASDKYVKRLQNHLQTPIKVSGEICGHLVIYYSKSRSFLIPEEQNLLNAVAEILGLWLERKQAEDALRSSEAKLRAQYQSIPVPTYTWQKVWDDIVLIGYNDAAMEVTKGNITDFVGIKAREMYHDMPEILEELAWCFAERSTLEREMFYRLKTTGEKKHLAVKYAFVHPDQVSVYTEDITERKRMEQYLLRSERLAAMGHMAATLAHEVQNPLQAIYNHLELVLDFDLEPEEKKEYLGFCCQEIERLTGITERVLGFARPSKDTLHPTSVAHLMQRALAVSKPLQHARIQVVTDIPADLPAVLVIPDQIVQVLLNLTINAIEAIPETGHVYIKAYIDQSRKDKDMVVLTLTNDGPSISPEHIEHIFDPFFTTKQGGTGLGLFISHNIIEQHGGMLSVENLPDDQGVTFGIALPIAHPTHEQEITV